MVELVRFMNDRRKHSLSLSGLTCSSASLFFSALRLSLDSQPSCLYLFILNDSDEAGYFCHDLTQILGNRQVLFFPSSYRYSKKFSQKDAANEILRTEVLSATHNYNGCGLASDDGSPQGSKFKPSTLNPQPSTLNLQPSTFNLQPSTLANSPSSCIRWTSPRRSWTS